MSEHEESPPGATTAPTTTAIGNVSNLLSATPKDTKETHQAHTEGWAAIWLEKADRFIYGLVGACFFLGALFTLGYAFYNFYHQFTDPMSIVGINGEITQLASSDPQNIAQAIIDLVSDLLLVLIIMEVLATVLHYLREHATSLKPFLFIGMISATRGVLAIGARLSVTKVIGDDFRNAMIELGVNAAVILALGITLRILSKYGATDVD